MSYSKSPESVVEAERQKSPTPELHPTDADSDRPQDSATVADRPQPVAKPEQHPTDADSDRPQDSATVADRPEPVAKRRSRWPLIAAIAIATGAAGFGGYSWQSGQNRPQQSAAAAQPKAIPVKLAAVETSSVQDASEFVSSLEAKRSVEIKPEAEGLVTEIFVKSGDFINKGQAIARMKSDSAQADLRQSQANLIRAQSHLAELQAGTRPEEIAQAEADLADAQTGSLLEDIAQARAQIEASTAEAKLATQQLARYQALAKEGAESANTLEQYTQKEGSARANLREAQ